MSGLVVPLVSWRDRILVCWRCAVERHDQDGKLAGVTYRFPGAEWVCGWCRGPLEELKR